MRDTRVGMSTTSCSISFVFAGYANTDGYQALRLNGRFCKAHRIGSRPHQWQSWRQSNSATRLQQDDNRCPQKPNTSGVEGVQWCKSKQKLVASVRFNGKLHNKCFDMEAVAIRTLAKFQLHGNYSTGISCGLSDVIRNLPFKQTR